MFLLREAFLDGFWVVVEVEEDTSWFSSVFLLNSWRSGLGILPWLLRVNVGRVGFGLPSPLPRVTMGLGFRLPLGTIKGRAPAELFLSSFDKGAALTSASRG